MMLFVPAKGQSTICRNQNGISDYHELCVLVFVHVLSLTFCVLIPSTKIKLFNQFTIILCLFLNCSFKDRRLIKALRW